MDKFPLFMLPTMVPSFAGTIFLLEDFLSRDIDCTLKKRSLTHQPRVDLDPCMHAFKKSLSGFERPHAVNAALPCPAHHPRAVVVDFCLTFNIVECICRVHTGLFNVAEAAALKVQRFKVHKRYGLSLLSGLTSEKHLGYSIASSNAVFRCSRKVGCICSWIGARLSCSKR